jgi:hypothetical protein
MPRRGRAVLSGLALAAFFALPLLPEILGTRRLVFRDAQITHWPWRRVAMESLASGRIPFVNAGSSGGQPLLANPNAVLLYPTVLLERVVGPASAFNLHYLLHVLWAFFGARLLARRLGRSEGAAFFGGVAFAFSGVFLSYASAFANSSAAAAWLPWCGCAALALARASDARQWRRGIAALALALGLQLLAGEPAISGLTLLLVAGIGVADRVAHPSGRVRGALRFLLSSAGAGIAAALFAAPLLLPLRQVFSLTYRGQHVYSDRAFNASPFTPWRILEWLFPRFAGDPGALGAGAHWQHAWHSGEVLYIWCVTFGVIPLILLVLAATSRGFWRRDATVIAAGSLLALFLAFGSTLPFFPALGAFEALRRLRYPIKFYLLTTLGVSLLSARALDHVSGRKPARREIFTVGAVVLLYAAGFAAAGQGGLLEERIRPALAGLAVPASVLLPVIRRTFRVDALLGLAASAIVAIVLLRRARPPAAGYFLGFSTLFFALAFGLPLFVSGDEKALERPPALLAALNGSGRLYVSPRLPEFNVLLTGTAHPQMEPRVSKLARVQIEELIPDTGQTFAVHYVFDSDPDGSYGYYNRIAGEALSVSTPEERSRLLRAYAGRWILAEEGEPYAMSRPRTGLTVAGRRLTLSELEDPVPELRWSGREFRRRSLSGALALLRSDRFDPASDVVLPGASDRDGTETSPARLAVDSVTADAASVRVEAARPGHVVFSRTYFSAWKARLDGAPAPVLVANARDLAVAVPEGEHHVDFRWDTGPFVSGVILQGAALILLILAAVSRRRF